MAKRALITGITGQDGSYLAEWLLSQGYEVHGLVRRTNATDGSHIEGLCNDPEIFNRRLFLHFAELTEATALRRVLAEVAADEVYHLAAQSHVGLSFDMAEITCEITAMTTLRLLSILRDLPAGTRFFHASSSEIFGRPASSPQDESTPVNPVNPYGCAKAYATQMARVYRENYRLHISNGILYNHESPRRGENFVTRKITRAAASIKLGLSKDLVMGSVEAQRDWGHAEDFTRGMWLALQQAEPGDYVFATGKLHSVRDVLDIAFSALNLRWEDFVKQDDKFMRPAEPSQLVGNAAKAKTSLNWQPKWTFGSMIEQMVRADYDRLQAQQR